MLPKTGTCVPVEHPTNQLPHASPTGVPPFCRGYLLRPNANPSVWSDGLLSSKDCGDTTQCGMSQAMIEGDPTKSQHRGLSLLPAQPSYRPINLKLKKSASLLEWLNKKLSEQGEACFSECERMSAGLPSLSSRGGEVTLQAVAQLSNSMSTQDTWQGLRAAASSCTSDDGALFRASFDSRRSVSLDPPPFRHSPDFLTASSGASMQASQSELDLEKFAASILLDDEPLPAPDLGPARASDSSLQGSSSEWEAMLIDNGSVETSNTGGTRDLGTACGALTEYAATVHPQPRVSLKDDMQPFPPTQSFNPFHSFPNGSAFQTASDGKQPSTGCLSLPHILMTGMPNFADAATDIMRARSASPLQSSMAGTAFASEPATPTGGMGSRLLRTVSSSFPAGMAVVASPSAAQRQRACRGSLDVLRSASSRVSKLVASTRNVALKEVPANDLLCDSFIGSIK